MSSTVLVRALGAHGAETLTAAQAGFIAARNLAANDESNTRALGAAGISAGGWVSECLWVRERVIGWLSG